MKITFVLANKRYKKPLVVDSICPWGEKFVSSEKYHFWEEGKGQATSTCVCIINSSECRSCKRTDSSKFKMLTKELLKLNNY